MTQEQLEQLQRLAHVAAIAHDERALDLLADAIADRLEQRLADRLAERLAPPEELPARPIISFDELLDLLPPDRSRETWRRWLYERLRHGEVPGAVKLGARWAFRADTVRQWLDEGLA